MFFFNTLAFPAPPGLTERVVVPVEEDWQGSSPQDASAPAVFSVRDVFRSEVAAADSGVVSDEQVVPPYAGDPRQPQLLVGGEGVEADGRVVPGGCSTQGDTAVLRRDALTPLGERLFGHGPPNRAARLF